MKTIKLVDETIKINGSLDMGDMNIINIADGQNNLDAVNFDQLQNKADSSTVTSQLASKADSSTVTSELATKANLSGATFTGNIDMGSNKITSSYTPSDTNDLTNKNYVDTKADSSAVYTKTEIQTLLNDLITSNPSLQIPSDWNW